jgi:arylformamidase
VTTGEGAVQRHAPIWRDMDRAALDRAYDNSSAVTTSQAQLAGWSARSAALRAREGHLLDLTFGPRERNRIDIFRCGADGAPLLVFIHGGYWQRNSKEIFSCMAEGPLAAGLDVALPGYTLAPDATLGEIVGEVRAAIRFLRQQAIARTRLVVSGWSAGAHLAASVMDMAEVDAGLAISGIYDLEPIRLGTLNDRLGLTPIDATRLSPIRKLPAKAGELVIAYGTAELAELQRQSRDYAAIWQDAGHAGALLPVAGADHFSILEELARPGGTLAAHAARLAGHEIPTA